MRPSQVCELPGPTCAASRPGRARPRVGADQRECPGPGSLMSHSWGAQATVTVSVTGAPLQTKRKLPAPPPPPRAPKAGLAGQRDEAGAGRLVGKPVRQDEAGVAMLCACQGAACAPGTSSHINRKGGEGVARAR